MDLDFQKVIAPKITKFGSDTTQLLAKVFTDDLNRISSTWSSGQKEFDEATRMMDSGYGCLGGVENCGKSNFANCLFMNILDHTEDSIVIDFILDDNARVRIHQLAAARGRLPVDIIGIPSVLSPQDPRLKQRKEAYQSLIDSYKSRLEIIDGTSWGGKGAYWDNIEQYLTSVRESFPTKKIWVNLDAFDDVIIAKGIPRGEKVDYTVEKITQLVTKLGATAPFWMMCVKHFNKGYRGRGVNNDAFKGSSALPYKANLTLTAYSEMGELGNQSNIFFYPDSKDFSKKNPILELQFTKNKVGGFKGKIFHFQYPDQYFCTECDQPNQEYYRKAIEDQSGGKEYH